MNARQKAKKYKLMYEVLLSRLKPTIEFKGEQYEIDTLKFMTLLPEQSVTQGNDDYIKRVVADTFADMLVKASDKYIEYSLKYLLYEQKHLLKWQIKVLKKLSKI